MQISFPRPHAEWYNLSPDVVHDPSSACFSCVFDRLCVTRYMGTFGYECRRLWFLHLASCWRSASGAGPGRGGEPRGCV